MNKLNLILVQVRGTEGGLMEGNGEVQRVSAQGGQPDAGVGEAVGGGKGQGGRGQSRGAQGGVGPEERGQGTSSASIYLPLGLASRF